MRFRDNNKAKMQLFLSDLQCLTILKICIIMEHTVIQRIGYILIESKLSKAAFAKTIGMDATTFWRQLKGEQALSAKLLEGVLKSFPDISAEWLLRGIGSMKVNQVDTILKNEVPKTLEQESIWKAKYEAIKECYDTLVSGLGTTIGKRNVG